MYGILNYQKLHAGILRGAQKYNQLHNQRNNFFHGSAGRNRGLNIAKIASQSLSNEQLLMLLFTINLSSSKVLFRFIATELIRGNFQYYKSTSRQNKKAVTLYSQVIKLSLLVHATKQEENYDEEEIADYCFIMKLNNTRSLRFIIDHIIKRYFSLIQKDIKQAALNINKKLQQMELIPNCIHRKCITDMLELHSPHDDESHIQLAQINYQPQH
jgi:hypothetical protein